MPTAEEGFLPTEANPLYRYRAPQRIPRKHASLHGDHFITQKGEVANDTGIREIYPGYFRLRSNPAQELDFIIWEDIDDERGESMAQWLRLTTMEGFAEAQFKEFDINFRIRNVWKKDQGGRITLGGRTKPAHVLMVRTGEVAAEREAERLSKSDDIQKSVEQKAASAVRQASEKTGQEIELTDVSMEEGEEIEVGLKEER